MFGLAVFLDKTKGHTFFASRLICYSLSGVWFLYRLKNTPNLPIIIV